jgi:hypothetical protein
MRETMTDEQAIEAARQDWWKNPDIEIDDDAVVSHTENGAWVAAWVWVSNEEGTA